MKTQSSPESGYFNPRICLTLLLWVCGAWLAAISFAPSALAWGTKSWGTPGWVGWSDSPDPIIGMGYDYATQNDFALYRHPTIAMSTAGTKYQYVAVTIYTYYSCNNGQWCYYAKDTKTTRWTPYGTTATVNTPQTHIPTTSTNYWTSIVQFTWYNSTFQVIGYKNFYPDRTYTMFFNYYDTDPQWWGNADMACNMFAVKKGVCKPHGTANGGNLNTPTGTIYCLKAMPGS
jgi:hypothetical protein